MNTMSAFELLEQASTASRLIERVVADRGVAGGGQPPVSTP